MSAQQMEFLNDAQRECYTAIRGWLSALYGESALANEEAPLFSCPVGDTLVGVAVQPIGEREAGVNIWTFPVGEGNAEPSEDALRFMLETNARLLFGALGLHADDGDIVLAYTVEWEGLTKDRLQSLIVTLAAISRSLQVDLARELIG